jgi:hypothetical protein
LESFLEFVHLNVAILVSLSLDDYCLFDICQYDNQKESLSSSLRNPRQLNSNNKDSNNNDRHGTPPPQTPQDLHSGQSNTATNNSSFSNIRAIHQQLKSPHEIIAESGSMETVRIRNVKNLLTDFFGGA